MLVSKCQIVNFQNIHILLTYHAYDATFILNTPPLLFPVFLKYSDLFF